VSDDETVPTPPTDRAAQLRAQIDDAPAIPLDEFRTRSRRSFLVGAAGIAGAGLAWRWLQHSPTDGGIPSPLRSTLNANERLWRNLSDGRHAQEFPASKASKIKVNGHYGVRDEIDLSAWTLKVKGPDGAQLDELDIGTFEALPQHDMVVEHKCVEGWSTIVKWGGARFRDFHSRYADQVGDVPWVGLETPDGGYYVGWDMASAMHPQTMLALRLDDQPLSQDHGAPLRLASPNKYGIKCLKRIGVIRYSNERPNDYWAERDYDYYAGL
jgi:DMSO/TMAO reductase YedYZ molybdopterin-dependent catalytic subunit